MVEAEAQRIVAERGAFRADQFRHAGYPGAYEFGTARDLAREEGVFADFSAGANVAAALQLLSGPEAGGTIGVLMCDSGLKYLSTDLWDDPFTE